MTKALSTILAGIFFFSSMTGMGQWSLVTTAEAKSFDLEEEDEDFDEPPAKTEDIEEDIEDKEEVAPPKKVEEDLDADLEDEPKAEEEKVSKPADDLEDEDLDALSDGESLAVFYYFADTTAEKKAQDIARTVGSYLKDLSKYRFFETEARLFNDFGFRKLTDDTEKAEKYLEEGKKFNEDADAEAAVGKFNAALDRLEKRIDVMHDYTLLTKVLFQVGATLTLLEEEDKAKEAFTKLLSVNPDYEAEEGTDDDTIDVFDKIKSNMMMQPLGDIKVTTEPAGATVYVDGKIVGMTPAKIEGMTAGKHYWRVHKNGYRDMGGITTVRDGLEAKIDETLTAGDGAETVAPLEKLALAEFGGAEMMKKAVEVGKAAKITRLLAFHTAIEEAEEGTTIKIQIRLVNPAKASFKEESVSFSLPGNGELSRSEDFRTALDNLFVDEYGFNPISTIVSGSLSTDGSGKDDDSVVNKWWFWTIIGVVVAGAAGGGAAAGILLSEPSKKSGATMTIQFGN
ncbi:MAG TPA: PEGA domain-containing protein [bacterium]|nr:PEGA domain-containing protein [bacterium]